MSQEQADPKAIAASWLSDYRQAVYEKDVIAFSSLFLPNGWFRDVLVFDWDNRSLEGPDKIKSYLTDRLKSSAISNIQLDVQTYLEPSLFPVSSKVSGIENERGKRRTCCGYTQVLPVSMHRMHSGRPRAFSHCGRISS